MWMKNKSKSDITNYTTSVIISIINLLVFVMVFEYMIKQKYTLPIAIIVGLVFLAIISTLLYYFLLNKYF